MGLIFYFSHQNAGSSNRQSGFLFGLVNRLFKDKLDQESTVHLIRKAAHFFVYLVLGIIAYNSIGRLNGVSFWGVLAFCALYAASDEIHQTFVPGRSGAVADVALDTLGAVLGMLIYLKTIKKGSRKK